MQTDTGPTKSRRAVRPDFPEGNSGSKCCVSDRRVISTARGPRTVRLRGKESFVLGRRGHAFEIDAHAPLSIKLCSSPLPVILSLSLSPEDFLLTRMRALLPPLSHYTMYGSIIMRSPPTRLVYHGIA